MSLPVKYNDFQLIVINCLSENNDIRTDAEDKYEKVPVLNKIEFLLKIISEKTMAREVSQLCAVLLRRMFFANYDTIEEVMTPEILEQIKNQILLLLKNPHDASLLKKMCEVAAELAKRLIDERNQNHWPELLKFMFECVNSQDLVLKECALNLLALVPGIFGNELERYLEVIRQMLYHCLTDNNLNLDIRTAAVKATSAFILHHETKKVTQHLSDCAVPMIHLIVSTISLDGEHCDTILKAVTDIAEKCPQFLRARTEDLIQLCLEALRGADIMDSRKHLCIEIVISLAENAPQTIRKRGTPYLGQLVSHLLLMMTTIEEDPEWGNVDVIEDDDFESNHVIGETSLDRLACSVGGKTILPLVLETISTMLQNPDWRHRFAAMMAVSAVGEGCHDQMLPMLPKIVSGILPFLSDAHPRVRYAACNALGQMASDFAPDFQEKFHNVVVPSLLTLLDDQMNPRVQAHAGAALVNFFEECPPKIVAIYLEQSAVKLEGLINMKINELMSKGTKLVLEQAVVTLASLADSAQEYFERYYDKFVPCLKAIIKMATTDELKILRGKAIECISLIGLAVGRDRFCADASEVMDMLLRTQTGEDQLAEDDPQLAYMISAWARICKILGSQFEPYLPYVMPPVLRAAAYQIQMQLLDDDDNLIVEKDWSRLTLDQVGIKTSGLEDKATALQMLVCYARELKQNFANYVEDVVKVVVPELKFIFHDGVRTAAAEILPYLLESAKPRGKEYVNGMWKYIFPELMQAIETEPEREVLSELMASLDSCITDLGREFLSDDQLEAIVKALDEHLKQYFERCEERSEKRKDEDYDEGVEETLVEEDDEDVFILSKVADVLHACFTVCKDYFLRYFDAIVHHFVKLAGSDRAWTEQHWAICVMDDVIEHGGPGCDKYKDFFIPLLVNGVQSTYPELRQASAYGWGVLARFGGPNFAGVFSACVSILVQMIQAPDAREAPNINATENAIAAITKILQYNSSQVNVNELLPLWFSWLPVWEDEEELPHVYGFLLYLIEHNHPIIMGENNSNLPRIVYIFMEVLARNAITLSSDVGQKIIALMNSLKNDALLFQRCVESLNTQHQEGLKQVLAYPGDGQ